MNKSKFSSPVFLSCIALGLTALSLSPTIAEKFNQAQTQDKVVLTISNSGHSLPVPVQIDNYIDLIDGRVSCVGTPKYSICRRLSLIKRHSKHTLYLDVYDHSGGRGNRIYLGTRVHNQPVDH
jgi:hypothetical protein